MKVRTMSLAEAEVKAPAIGRRHFLAGGLALALLPEADDAFAPAKAQDAFSIDDLLRAVEVLKKNAVPAHSDGTYSLFIHPNAKSELDLESALCRDSASYRKRLHAWAILSHERRREDLGKRGHVSAEEVLARLNRIA